MTPLGHIASAFILSKANKKICVAAIIFGSLLPDIDFLFVFLPFFNHIHRVFTHNIFFVILGSLLSINLLDYYKRNNQAVFLSFPIKKALNILRISKEQDSFYFGLSVFIGGFSHLLIDACWDSNASNGIGIAFFWPLTGNFFSPFNLLPINSHGYDWTQPGLMLQAMLPYVLFEVPLFLVALLLLISLKK